MTVLLIEVEDKPLMIATSMLLTLASWIDEGLELPEVSSFPGFEGLPKMTSGALFALAQTFLEARVAADSL